MSRKRPIASVYLEPHVLEALDRIATRERRSRSNLISVIVTEALNSRAQTNSVDGAVRR